MNTPTAPAPAPVPQARVLVVDDHPSTATTLARAISQLGPGIEVISATSGAMALEMVKNGAVDVLITDMMMPDMNGLQVIENLQTHPGGRPTYTVLITAYDVPGLKESARRLKVNEIVIKPFRPERICQIVSKALEDMGHSKQPKSSMGARTSYNILVADDVSDNVALLSRYLKNEGYTLVAAANGVEALAKTRSEMPDLILLDVNMPEKDGFAVLREIRSDPAIEHIPVIILTAARPDPVDMQYGLNLGADDYVTKPFDRRELLARIRTKLRVKEAEDIMRRRYKELSVLPEIGKDLSARLDIDDLTKVILRRTVETLGAMLGHILILNQARPYHDEYRISSPTLTARELKLPPLDGLLNEIRETRQGLIIENTNDDPRWQNASGDPACAAILAPLFGHLDLIGVLVLIHEHAGYFNPEHQLLLQAIASQAAIAVENAQLFAGMAQGQQRLAAVLQSSADGILMFDADGRLASVNPAGEKMFGGHAAQPGLPLTAGNGYDGLIALLEQARSSQQPKIGEIAWPGSQTFMASITPIEDGGCIAILHGAASN